MSRRFLIETITLLCVLVGFRDVPCSAADGREGAGKDFFGTTKVWDIHLELSGKEYEAMQPVAGGFNVPGAPPAPRARKDKRDSERNLFGTEFPWAQGTLTVGNQTYKNIAIRY